MPGRQAVVIAQVDVEKLPGGHGLAERLGPGSFFDVDVEGVHQQADCRVVQLLQESQSLGDIVEQVAFEAVKWFQGNAHPGIGCPSSGPAQDTGQLGQ